MVVAPVYRAVLTGELRRLGRLLQLAAVVATLIVLPVVEEIPATVQVALALLVLPGVLQVHNQRLIRQTGQISEFLKAVRVQSSMVLLTEEVELVALQTRTRLAELV
jgi:hypothetical protein